MNQVGSRRNIVLEDTTGAWRRLVSGWAVRKPDATLASRWPMPWRDIDVTEPWLAHWINLGTGCAASQSQKQHGYENRSHHRSPEQPSIGVLP